MGHSTEYEHLGADVPDTKIVTPRTMRFSGEPMDWERLVADAHAFEERKPKPSRLRRIIDTLRMAW